MRDLVATAARGVLSVAAVLYLWMAAPLDLAMSLARILSGPTTIGLLAGSLIAARIVVVGFGLTLGLRVAQRATGTTGAAVAWAAADLGTLAVLLATSALPASRAPGDGPIVWAASALAALVVVAASAWGGQRERAPD